MVDSSFRLAHLLTTCLSSSRWLSNFWAQNWHWSGSLFSAVASVWSILNNSLSSTSLSISLGASFISVLTVSASLIYSSINIRSKSSGSPTCCVSLHVCLDSLCRITSKNKVGNWTSPISWPVFFMNSSDLLSLGGLVVVVLHSCIKFGNNFTIPAGMLDHLSF